MIQSLVLKRLHLKIIPHIFGLIAALLLLFEGDPGVCQQYKDFATYLMRATFKIQADGIIGTGFIVGAPLPEKPETIRYVLVTATHVLDSMQTDNALIFLRKRNGNKYKKDPHRIAIRRSGKPQWLAHKNADVAILPIRLPDTADFRAAPIQLLATDEHLVNYEIHPGDEVFVLGFPFGVESGPDGFPILRSGRIASFPLTPVGDTQTFLIDFEVFKGNSGGPVFLASANRFYDGSVHIGMTYMLLGVVSMEKQISERLNVDEKKILRTHRLSIATVVHAQFLKDLIQQALSDKSWRDF